MARKEGLFMTYLINKHKRNIFYEKIRKKKTNVPCVKQIDTEVHSQKQYEHQVYNGRVKFLKLYYENIHINKQVDNLSTSKMSYSLNPNVTKLVEYFEQLSISNK
ncbi:hypothetical protein BDAP_002050 [Binucleata daphniae]